MLGLRRIVLLDHSSSITERDVSSGDPPKASQENPLRDTELANPRGSRREDYHNANNIGEISYAAFQDAQTRTHLMPYSLVCISRPGHLRMLSLRDLRYVGLVYGILYLFFTAFPISFQQDRGWGEVSTSSIQPPTNFRFTYTNPYTRAMVVFLSSPSPLES